MGYPIQQKAGMEVSSNHASLFSEQRVDGDMLRSIEERDAEVFKDSDSCDKREKTGSQSVDIVSYSRVGSRIDGSAGT
jgi:hypothetical protein